MTPEEFRRAGHELIDWIADFRATLESRPVMARTAPGEVARAFPATPPETPQPLDEIFRTLDASIVPGITHFGHPRFFGFFPTGGSLSSILGDFASTGLGALGLTWQSAPALTEVEEVTTDWVRQMVGLSAAWRGVIQDTASTATLVALVCARERASDFALTREGLQGGGAPLVDLRVGPEPQLGAEGRARRRLRADARPRDRHRRRPCDAAGSARGRDARGSRPRLDTVRRRRDVRVDDVHRVRSDRRDRDDLRGARRLAARRRGDGGVGDGPRRVPAAVGRRRARRLDRAQPAQVARRDLRLLALSGARSRAPGAGDEHQPGLPAVDRGGTA